MNALTFFSVFLLILPYVYGNRDPQDPRNHPGSYGSECTRIYRPFRFGRSIAEGDEEDLEDPARRREERRRRKQGTCADGLCCNKKKCRKTCRPHKPRQH